MEKSWLKSCGAIPVAEGAGSGCCSRAGAAVSQGAEHSPSQWITLGMGYAWRSPHPAPPLRDFELLFSRAGSPSSRPHLQSGSSPFAERNQGWLRESSGSLGGFLQPGVCGRAADLPFWYAETDGTDCSSTFGLGWFLNITNNMFYLWVVNSCPIVVIKKKKVW